MEFNNLRKNEKETKIKTTKKIKLLFEYQDSRLSKRKPNKNLVSEYNIVKEDINKSYIDFQEIKNRNKKILFITRNKLQINFRKYFFLLKLYIIILINYSLILCKFNKRILLLESSEITLKTKGTGTFKILSDSFFQLYNQCQIYINDNNQTEIKNEYNFNEQNNGLNIVRITWDIKINTTRNMFSGCSNITEIDLSKFKTIDVICMSNMFSGCSSLISLNLSNIDTSGVTIMDSVFQSCSNLISLDLSYFNISKAIVIAGMFYGCTNLEYVNFSDLKLKNGVSTECIFEHANNKLIICSENEDKKMSALLTEIKDIHCNNYNYTNTKICYSKDSSFDNKFICDTCGKNYDIKNNVSDDNNTYINCFGETKGFYLDEIDWIYRPCYLSCKRCKINGDNNTNNCIECKEEYIYEINISNTNLKNCYINNPFDDNLNNNSQIKNKTEIILNAINKLITNINIIELNSGDDKSINFNNKQIILTSTTNQKINEDKNNITMDLGQCENKLKNNYNISYNNSLYILQIISEEKGMKIPKLEYEIYYPLNNDEELKKLNLTYCKDSKIDISISVKIDGQLDKYNSSSDYYNNICYKTSSESGTDISLNDRRNEFVNNNITLCEENCELIDYDYIKAKAKCSCDIKTSISSYDDIKFNKNDFFKSFIDIKNIFNIEVMKCYKIVFKIKELKKNFGFFIIGFVFILYLITLLTFIIKSNSNFKNEIKNIILALKFNEMPIKNNQEMKKKIIINNKIKINNKKKNYSQKKDKLACNKNNKSKIKNNSKAILFNFGDNISRKLYKNKKENICENNISIENILKRKEFELNSLDYQEALKIDHRSYCQYYYHLLKYNHPISFSFASYNDYNMHIIKNFLFFFSFCSDFTINALFFTDETIHKIYQDKGKFNFLYQIPQTLYSTLIGRFIDSLIKNLAITQDNIIELKEENTKKLESKYKKLLKVINIKFFLFFIFSYIVLVFFWYYIACFCGIYINTQSHLIKDSVISLITSLLIPFGLSLIPGIFRILSLNVKKPSRKYLYKFSMFLENYLS